MQPIYFAIAHLAILASVVMLYRTARSLEQALIATREMRLTVIARPRPQPEAEGA